MKSFEYPKNIGFELSPAQNLEFALYWPNRSPERYVELSKESFPLFFDDSFTFDGKRCATIEQAKDSFLLVTKTKWFLGRFHLLTKYGNTKNKTPVFTIKENKNVSVTFKR